MKNASSRSLLVTAAVALWLGSALSAPAAAYFWNVTTPAANSWNVDGNWDVANFPGFGGSITDVATFGATGTSANSTTINNVVSANTTIATLNFTNTTSGAWHVTQIPSGSTLTVSGVTTVGFGTAANILVTSVAMTGGGTLALNGNLTIGNNGSSSADQGTVLDLSGLTNFIYNASGGNITLSTGNRSGADMKLAGGSNYITAANLNANSASSSSGASGTVFLGATTNNINMGAISMAQARNNSTMQFLLATGGLRLRGVGGTDNDRASLILANRNAGTSGGNNQGTMNFNGHPVDIKFSTVTMGQCVQASGVSGAQSGTGVINFNTGTIDATSIAMAISGGTNFNSGIATITVGTNSATGTSGTLIVGAGGISLANQGTQGTSTGNLNISGGSVICSGAISKANGTGTGNINITNGTLAASGTVGTLAVPLNSLVVSNAILQLAASATTTNVVVANLNAITGATNTINISAMPVIPTFPSQLALIKYTTGSGDLTTFALGTLPSTFQGYISNNVTSSSIDLVVTNGPTPPPAAKAVTWDGEVSGNWDTTTTNWANSGNLTNYNDVTLSNTGDNVTFDDTLLGTTNINLTQALSPTSLTVNNTASNYLFTGVGKLSGTTSLAKSGTGLLVIANNGVNDFTGGMNISAGTVQFGNGTTAGSLPASGAITDNGTLVINHSDSFTVTSAISGSGSLVQVGNGTLTLSNASSYTGGLTVNKGAVRANTVGAPGTTLVTVSGGTFVVGAALTNSITLSNGVLGTSLTGGFTMSTNKELTISANSTNLIYSADPQTPTTSFQFLIDGNLRGSGTIVCINPPVTSPDSGQGVRFRNTNAVSDFSGTIIYTNGNKGELLTAAPDGSTYSPIGTGKLVLYCGNYFGTNGTFAPTNGTAYSELNLRNNGTGSLNIGNDITLMGTGSAIINALAGSNGITMGKLTIGASQELIGYKASGSPAVTNVVIFPTVSLAGNATFSPHSTSFGAASQFGTDFSLGAITETVGGSSITKGGLGNLTFTGVNNYSGNTTVTNGTLTLNGSASIANSPNIVVGGGATLDVSTLSSTFTLGAAQTLSNITSTAALSGNADASVGTVSLRYASGTPSFTVLNGALTVAAGTPFKVNNTGAALIKGNYKLISAGTGGSVAGTAPSAVTVGGSGLAGAGTPSLQINANELYLVVPNSAPTIAHIVTNTVASGLTWKISAASLAAAAGWSDIDNDTLTITAAGPTSNLGKSVTEDGNFVFYNAAVTGEDFLTYTISDGTTTANGTIYLEPSGPPPAPANLSLVVTGGNGVATITFAGIPGRTNVVEASSNLVDWNAISTNVAGTNGLWQVIDSDAPNFVNRYYRSYQVYP